jgi:hypothetical protein
VEASTELTRGRELYAGRAWAEAHEALAAADAAAELEAGDIELLATASYMVGRRDEYAEHLDRAFQAHEAAQRPLPAARCAFWLGLDLMLRGEAALANGWFARAARLADAEE